jgi:hypothetical protein
MAVQIIDALLVCFGVVNNLVVRHVYDDSCSLSHVGTFSFRMCLRNYLSSRFYACKTSSSVECWARVLQWLAR